MISTVGDRWMVSFFTYQEAAIFLPAALEVCGNEAFALIPSQLGPTLAFVRWQRMCSESPGRTASESSG
jgi:hypothetical protein